MFLKSYFLCFPTIFEHQETSTVLVTPSSCNPIKGTQKRIQYSAGHDTIDTENILAVKKLFKRQGREESGSVMEEEDKRPTAKPGSKFTVSKWISS